MTRINKKRITGLLTVLFTIWSAVLFAQIEINGQVRDFETKEPLVGATIIAENGGVAEMQESGFGLKINTLPQKLSIRFVGYENVDTLIKEVEFGRRLIIELEPTDNLLEEVNISTGYYTLPKERATGSFTYIDNTLLNRSTSAGIIDRLEGIANGLQFERNNQVQEVFPKPELRVRGVSSIKSEAAPLIIVDGFPYEGDIDRLNPEDVKDVTILKDAAAASIWGATAGNGVIVINTKQGSKGTRPQFTFSTNFISRPKPDLFYNRSFLPASERMEIEEFLFEKGHYSERDWIWLPDYVELLYRRERGEIGLSEFEDKKFRMTSTDIREQADRYLYRRGMDQRYNFNVSGGSHNYSYYLSSMYNNNQSQTKHRGSEQVTVSMNNVVNITPRLKLNSKIVYTHNNSSNDGLTLSDLGRNLSPYSLLVNDNGAPAVLNRDYKKSYVDHAENNGLLNWHYVPLEEIGYRELIDKSRDLRLAAGLEFNVFTGFDVRLQYQYHNIDSDQKNLYDEESYYVRNILNTYTQEDGSVPIPFGGILRGLGSNQKMHHARIQVDYNKSFSEKHEVAALAGAEINQSRLTSLPGYQVYGYSDESLVGTSNLNYDQLFPMNPRGSGRLPNAPGAIRHITDRFISYYSNLSYSYDKRLLASASIRWDASNLFGVKTNQRGVPLWSAGAAWTVSRESGFDISWLSVLKLRATYGYSGNVNKSISTYPTIDYSSADLTTNLPFARVTSAGNPALRWEKVTTTNFGLDWVMANNRLTGSFEYFIKYSKDLLGENFMDPTTGIFGLSGLYAIDNRVNYANMLTNGMDISINSLNIKGPFSWRSALLLNFSWNEVTDYMLNTSISPGSYFSRPNPVVGKPLDALYAWPWAGLSPENGMILAPDGTQEYRDFIRAAEYDDLLYMGVDTPPFYSSLRNTFAYNGFVLGFNLIWKDGHHFRRSSIDYNSLFNNGNDHVDFMHRWKQPGDERSTIVPAMPSDVDRNRDDIFSNAEVLVEKAGFVKLKDINFSYSFDWSKTQGGQKRITVYSYLNNVAMLWAANSLGVDPESPNGPYPRTMSISLGAKLEF